MPKYWFKARRYGWGWTPATWQGWLVMAIYIMLVILTFRSDDQLAHSVSDTLINFIPHTLVLTLIVIFIAYQTGEPPHWRRDEKH